MVYKVGNVAYSVYGQTLNNGRFLGVFGREEDIVIPCADIRVVGSDIVLIERSEASRLSHITNKRRISL